MERSILPSDSWATFHLPFPHEASADLFSEIRGTKCCRVSASCHRARAALVQGQCWLQLPGFSASLIDHCTGHPVVPRRLMVLSVQSGTIFRHAAQGSMSVIKAA